MAGVTFEWRTFRFPNRDPNNVSLRLLGAVFVGLTSMNMSQVSTKRDLFK